MMKKNFILFLDVKDNGTKILLKIKHFNSDIFIVTNSIHDCNIFRKIQKTNQYIIKTTQKNTIRQTCK